MKTSRSNKTMVYVLYLLQSSIPFVDFIYAPTLYCSSKVYIPHKRMNDWAVR